MLVTDNARVEHAGGGVERVDGGVDSELGNLPREHGGGVEMSEGRRGRGVRKIVGRHVDRLDTRNRSLLGGSNALLERTKIRGEGGLVSYSGGDAAEERGHLGARLGEAEDVVDEEEHILSLVVAKVLGDGESGESYARARARGLVHLSVHERSLRSFGGALAELDDACFNHLVVEVISLAGALADARKDTVSSVVGGDVIDELHNNDGFSDARTAKETNLTSLGVGGEKIDDLDTGGEDLLSGALLREKGRLRGWEAASSLRWVHARRWARR